jgi:hypothetical protein
MEPAAFMSAGQVRQQMRSFKLECFAEFDHVNGIFFRQSTGVAF